jgi:glycosyltransferase involved in cell wall biosynthesis
MDKDTNISGSSPLVSIIMRTKDRPTFLGRALESVRAQTYGNWELIVINDGGTVGAVDSAVAVYRDLKKVRVVHNERSKGMEAASNQGIQLAIGEFLVIHDDDDTWEPEFLKKCVDYLSDTEKNLKVGGVVARTRLVFEKVSGDKIVRVSQELFKPDLSNISLFELAKRNQFVPISFLFRKSILEKVGLFREDLPVIGDWEFHLRVAAQYEIGFLDIPLANWHQRPALSSGAMSNSVIAGETLHRQFDAQLRNELLRNDISEGKFGLGALVNLAKEYSAIEERLIDVKRGVAHSRRINTWLLNTWRSAKDLFS